MPFDLRTTAAAILAVITVGCAGSPKTESAAPAEIYVDTATTQPVTQEPVPAATPAGQQDPVEIKPSAPEQYVVQRGDTLWDISSTFLREPWYWPEIWHVNPQIENPHLIYPGDVITLYYVGGRPQVGVTGGPRVSGGVVKLSPRVRTEAIDSTRMMVPIQAIRHFIIHPLVLSEKEIDSAPYIVSGEEYRLIFGSGDTLYIKDLKDRSANNKYHIVRRGETLRDPKTGERLGIATIPVGTAHLYRDGEPASMIFDTVKREALPGDRLFPMVDAEPEQSFAPHGPAKAVDASVISLFNALSQIGALQIAVINLGERDGIDKGTVVAVYEAGKLVSDPYGGDYRPPIRLPEEKAGVLMVFRTFEKVSYALVMEAERPINLGDAVRNP